MGTDNEGTTNRQCVMQLCWVSGNSGNKRSSALQAIQSIPPPRSVHQSAYEGTRQIQNAPWARVALSWVTGSLRVPGVRLMSFMNQQIGTKPTQISSVSTKQQS
jgi:hypothetical protein